ncbi:MAG: tetratricopeptide repeat protein [Halopenitus sp.]
MIEYSTRDLVCRYLDVHDARSESPAPWSVTAAGIGDALELGDTATARVELLNLLESLREDGLLDSEERPIVGQETPRSIYFLTDAGYSHAESFHNRIRSESIVVTNGTSEEISLTEVDQYLEEADAPLVRALARLDEDNRMPLERRFGRQFVDRREELETVRTDITASFERESRTVTISGAGGMGKTTLVREALADVSDDHDPVAAWGACTAGPTDPYAPLARAFDSLPDDELLARLAQIQEETTPTDPARVDAERAALFEDLADELRNTAADTPVVLILDNVQWADAATLQLFVHFATSITEWLYPIAFVATHRPTAPAADQQLVSALDRLEEADVYSKVALDPFEPTDTEALLAGTIDRQEFPREFVDLIQEHTGGVPLFVEETATQIAESDAVDVRADSYPTTTEALGLPEEVVDHIDERVGSLDEDARELVQLGAIIGEYIPGGVLAEASDLPPARRREYEDALVASHVLEHATPEPRGDGGQAATGDTSADGNFRFASGVAREAVVDGLSDSKVESYHARIADAFTTVYEDRLEDHAARIAHHYEQAADYSRAIEFYQLAGDQARETYAHQDAITNYERAFELCRSHGDVTDANPAAMARRIAEIRVTIGEPESAIEQVKEGLDLASPDSLERCRLLGVKADAERSRGNYDSTRETARKQRQLAADLDASGLEADALRNLGIAARRQVEPETARNHFQAALDAYVAVDDRRGIATVTKRLGNVALGQGELVTAREHYERALATFEWLEDRRGIADVQNNLGIVANSEGDVDTAQEYFEQALEGFETVGERQNAAIAHLHLGSCAHEQRNPDVARHHYEESLSIHKSIDATHGVAESHKRLGTHEFWQGEYETARDHYERALEGYEAVGDREGTAEATLELGKVAHELCEDATARERYDDAQSIFAAIDNQDGVASVNVERARTAARRGDYEVARDYLADARDEMKSADDNQGVARVSLRLGDVERALGTLTTPLNEYRDALDTLESAADSQVVAVARLVFGRLALASGDQNAARKAGQRANEAFTEMDATHWIGRSRQLLGRVAADAGKHDAAQDHWRAALDAFESVGAPQDMLAVLKELVSLRRESGEDHRAKELCRRAEELLSKVPDGVSERHRQWVDACGTEPDEPK